MKKVPMAPFLESADVDSAIHHVLDSDMVSGRGAEEQERESARSEAVEEGASINRWPWCG
jgi:hypothetical protein